MTIECNNSTPNLPDGYVFKQKRGLFCTQGQDEKYIGNFVPFVHAVDIEGKERRISFSLLIADPSVESGRHMAVLSAMKGAGFFSTLDYRILINPNCRGAEKLVLYVLEYQVSQMQAREIIVIERLGWHKLKNQHIYAAGNKIIGAEGLLNLENLRTAEQLQSFRFDFDETLASKEAAELVFEHLSEVQPISAVLTANLIAGLTRSLFMDAGFPPAYVIYLIGGQGCGKTTQAMLTSSIFNRSTGMDDSLILLSSTVRSAETHLSLYRDCPCILDDLRLSDSAAVMNAQEHTLDTIIRSVANGTSRQHMDGKKNVKMLTEITLVCTGEYLMQTPSTLTRCIILEMQKPAKNGAVSKMYNDPFLLPTFVYHFLKWCAKNYDGIVNFIIDKYNQYLQDRAAGEFDQERLKKNGFHLTVAFEIFVLYYEDLGLLNRAQAENSNANFVQLMNGVLKRQLQLVGQASMGRHAHPYECGLLELLDQNIFRLRKHKKDRLVDFDGFLKDGMLCLKTNILTERFQELYVDKSISMPAVTKYLKNLGVLETDRSGKSTKKVNGIRLLHIRLKKLCAVVKNC